MKIDSLINNHALLLAILLLIAVTLLIVFICIILYQRKSIIRLKDECEDLYRQIEIKDNRIKSLKREQSELKKPKPSVAEIAPVKAEIIKDLSSTNVEEVIVKEEKDTSQGGSLKLYATAYDSDSNSFFSVDAKPTVDTIFEITISPHIENEAFLDLYVGAIEKIIDCKDFLKGSCEQIGFGDKMEILERGELVLEDGVWRIKKLLKIKFS